jgi:hypothetical protein
MPGSSIPGTLGCGANHATIDRGTSALTDMPAPTPIGSCTETPSAGITPRGGSRTMTAAEIAMSRLIFKDAVKYTTVKVHNGGYFGNLQWKRTAVTPNGEIYFNPEDFLEDFSNAEGWKKRWFIHEMVHVWQYQLGFWVKPHGFFSFLAPYLSLLTREKRLSDYGMEQQGEILADYYVLTVLKDNRLVRNQAYKDDLPLFENHILVDFLADPSSKGNLPRVDQDRPTPNGP